jgi:outer membrane protein assembly factor BamB
MRITLPFFFVFAVLTAHSHAAENWPQWRGPGANGVAAVGTYPTTFSASRNVAWKVELPGLGSSTPAVWDDHIFVTCGIDGRDGVCCYDWNGKQRWQVKFGPERPGKHRNGTGSNPSAVTDGQHVFVYYKSGTVAGLDFDGKVLWTANLQKRFGEDTLWWDLGTSPVLAADNVVVAVMHEGDSYLVALDRRSGKVAWRQLRDFRCPTESGQSYSTPIVMKADDREVIITWGADHLTSHDAATGELIWSCGGFNPNNEGYWRTIASPSISRGVAIVPYGRAEFLAGVRLGGKGDVTSQNRLWEKTGFGADVPTPAARDGKAYLLTDRGRLVCLDITTGKELWSATLPRNKNKYYSSPILAGNTIYCVREDGTVFVGDLEEQFRLLAENDMGERIVASPVPIRGSLLIRGNDHLFRIDR